MIRNTYPGKFIVFDGLDGSGQTTQADLLKKFLERKKIKVVLTKEPTKDSRVAHKIRKVLDEKEEISARELQELFVEDRKSHLEKVIIPALRGRKWVISDRYFFSTFAFGSLECDLAWLIKINDQFLLPDLTIFLRVAPEICIRRIEEREKAKTFFEKEEKLKKVWRVYETLPKRFKNVYIINGERQREEIARDIKNLALKVLKLTDLV